MDNLADECLLHRSNATFEEEAHQQGFTHRVDVRDCIPPSNDSVTGRAIAWLNTHPDKIPYRYTYDYDAPLYAFWLNDQQIAFEFKMRFG